AKREAKLLQTLARPEKFAVACSCEIVRRRLIESGLAPELAVVIRPGVDFALINKCRRGSLREELGARGDDYVVIVPEPVTRTGGQFEGVWATTLLNHLSGGIRLIIPGESREQRRIARFAGALPVSVPLVMPGSRYPFEELLTASDALLITPRGDISTTSIAWATAAGVAVIAAAVPPIAELISNKLNGLLFKQTPGRSMAAAIVRFLRDRESQEKVKEAARGWAYEVFSLHRYVEQTMRLYENVVSGATLKVKQALPGCFVGNYTGGEA
ncbi:MAG: glycosyltransferase, partial [Phycisphaerae bacterium]